jgi:hypothetical protein
MESILTSIKKLLGITEEYGHFDTDIIIHINSVFSDLTQLGVGPSEGFNIGDKNNLWREFIPVDNAKLFNNVKTYMYLRVKLLFDPPPSSFVLTSMEKQIEKLEWRLNAAAESNDSIGEEENQNG